MHDKTPIQVVTPGIASRALKKPPDNEGATQEETCGSHEKGPISREIGSNFVKSCELMRQTIRQFRCNRLKLSIRSEKQAITG